MKSTLDWAVRAWYLVTALGMWLFVYFIVAFYYGPTLRGNFESWNSHHLLTHGHVPGETAGNLMFAAHVLLAAVLTIGGTIQLVPQLRQHALVLHRWNGRLFLVTALLVSVAGLGLNLLRGIDKHGGSWPSPIDLNGVLILVFAVLAWRFVRRGDIVRHRRWALRTFMVVSGVWFLRLGVSVWIIATATLYGEPKAVSAFFAVWSWGCFLFPLVVLEVYFRALEQGGQVARHVVAGMLGGLTLLTAVGVFGAWQVFWSPLL